ncbi:hypothetical protein LLEC1_01438 [Akanthomyces lecanii]|uniref:Rhodopsin domain-containing protein n=1 Tax=Cordyceps confragosa TaxID=2714763 RepID=A0A179I5S2_CORDF|nr:hypothetical protein LLEC1_01438 [Akanthomyces lecanii]
MSLPSCAISCVTAICSQAGIICLCASDGLERTADTCISAWTRGRLISHQPGAAFRNITETNCQTPVRDESTRFIVMVILVVLAAGAMVVGRIGYKQFFSVTGRLDSTDWSIMAATLVCLPSIAVNVSMSKHGLGKDIWGVSPHDLKLFGLYFYGIQILYPLLMALVKISRTLFYLTLFPGRTIRALLWGTVASMSPSQPRRSKYDLQELKLAYAHCMNINASGWAYAAITLASDVWLIGIPLSQIRKLRLHWKKKVGATLMFLTGAGITIVSILRLQSIRFYANTTNPTWD